MHLCLCGGLTFNTLRTIGKNRNENKIFATLVIVAGSVSIFASIVRAINYTHPTNIPIATVPLVMTAAVLFSHLVTRGSDFHIKEDERRVLLITLSAAAIILFML